MTPAGTRAPSVRGNGAAHTLKVSLLSQISSMAAATLRTLLAEASSPIPCSASICSNRCSECGIGSLGRILTCACAVVFVFLLFWLDSSSLSRVSRSKGRLLPNRCPIRAHTSFLYSAASSGVCVASMAPAHTMDRRVFMAAPRTSFA